MHWVVTKIRNYGVGFLWAAIIVGTIVSYFNSQTVLLLEVRKNNDLIIESNIYRALSIKSFSELEERQLILVNELTELKQTVKADLLKKHDELHNKVDKVLVSSEKLKEDIISQLAKLDVKK